VTDFPFRSAAVGVAVVALCCIVMAGGDRPPISVDATAPLLTRSAAPHHANPRPLPMIAPVAPVPIAPDYEPQYEDVQLPTLAEPEYFPTEGDLTPPERIPTHPDGTPIPKRNDLVDLPAPRVIPLPYCPEMPAQDEEVAP